MSFAETRYCYEICSIGGSGSRVATTPSIYAVDGTSIVFHGDNFISKKHTDPHHVGKDEVSDQASFLIRRKVCR